jgi:hypothetical protein
MNCKKKIPGKKGYPKFQKHNRSVEYKVSGWKLSENRKHITFTDKKGIGCLKLIGRGVRSSGIVGKGGVCGIYFRTLSAVQSCGVKIGL